MGNVQLRKLQNKVKQSFSLATDLQKKLGEEMKALKKKQSRCDELLKKLQATIAEFDDEYGAE